MVRKPHPVSIRLYFTFQFWLRLQYNISWFVSLLCFSPSRDDSVDQTRVQGKVWMLTTYQINSSNSSIIRFLFRHIMMQFPSNGTASDVLEPLSYSILRLQSDNHDWNREAMLTAVVWCLWIAFCAYFFHVEMRLMSVCLVTQLDTSR